METTRLTHRLGLVALTIATIVTATSNVGASVRDNEPGQHEAVAVASAAPLRIHNATPEQIELVHTAVGRFADEGLQLPDIEITFAPDFEDCGGNGGLYQSDANGGHASADQITICHRLPLFLFHELAHAWEHHALDNRTRDSLLDAWGLPAWNDHGHEWSQRGTETAAQSVAYALAADGPVDNANILRFACEYQAITGAPFPTAIAASCDSTQASLRAG